MESAPFVIMAYALMWLVLFAYAHCDAWTKKQIVLLKETLSIEQS